MSFEYRSDNLNQENTIEKKEAEESALKKKIKKQLITGALLGASVVGGVAGSVYESSKVDSERDVQATKWIETHKITGTVLGKIVTPEHAQTIPTMVGKSIGVVPMIIPASYSLNLSTENGDRLIAVTKSMFDAVHVGTRVESADGGKTITIEK